MELPRVRKRCEACQQIHLSPCSPAAIKSHYFYLERTQTNGDAIRKESDSRPSSAGSTKSSPCSKKKHEVSSKFASSDSKIMKKSIGAKMKINPLKNREEKPSEIDRESIQQLKHDLVTIKEQLLFLTKNRNEALNITDELQVRYANLLKKNEDCKKEIEVLNIQNRKLLGKLQNQKSLEITSMKNAVSTKKNLDQYEETLSSLYGEFVDSSKVMEQTRDRICRCIKEKNDEFKELVNSKKELFQSAEEKDMRYAKLMEDFQKAKENEFKYEKRNEELLCTANQLENELNRILQDFETFRNEAISTEKRQQNSMSEKIKCYTHQLELKGQEIDKLSSVIEKLKSRICECNGNSANNDIVKSNYEQLLVQYEQLLQKLKIYEESSKKRFKEIQLMKKNEKDLVCELVKLQNFVEELTKINNDNNVTIAALTTSNQEKDSMIQCQRSDLDSKDKQIELLLKSEERLKRRTIQLQEDLVSMKISSNQDRTNKSVLLTTEDCSIHLTEELQDLITALYEEIDKTCAKDEHIQKQHQNICCLQCALSVKEKELTCVRNELKIVRDRLAAILKEKEVLADHLEKLKIHNTEYVEERYAMKSYYEA